MQVHPEVTDSKSVELSEPKRYAATQNLYDQCTLTVTNVIPYS